MTNRAAIPRKPKILDFRNGSKVVMSAMGGKRTLASILVGRSKTGFAHLDAVLLQMPHAQERADYNRDKESGQKHVPQRLRGFVKFPPEWQR
jgi:hypothetical protein